MDVHIQGKDLFVNYVACVFLLNLFLSHLFKLKLLHNLRINQSPLICVYGKIKGKEIRCVADLYKKSLTCIKASTILHRALCDLYIIFTKEEAFFLYYCRLSHITRKCTSFRCFWFWFKKLFWFYKSCCVAQNII